VPAETFLASLTDAERDSLLAAGQARRWATGEPLVRRGESATSAIVLLAGSVKVHTTAPEGAEVVLAFSGPGDLLGEISAVGDAVRSANATATEPVEGVEIDVVRLRSFLSAHPRATLSLLELAVARLYLADARRMEFATSESLGRVAARLAELAERFGAPAGDGAIEVALPITQEELASWSASSRESTVRALRTLRSVGLIETSRRRFTVLDLERLRSHAARL
jgi:CRP/FNR family cyclic AMP-dependent transcriptional regulator